MTPLRIATASDARYLPGAIGTLASTRMAVPEETRIEVLFLHDGLAEPLQQRLRAALARLRGDTSIDFVRIDGNFPGYPDFYFPSKLTYARLLLPAICPPGRLLYLDADLLVLKNPAPLCERESGPAGLSAAVETGIRTISGDPPRGDPGFPVDPRAPYFNAGVLALDLEAIRANGLFRRASDLLATRGAICKLHDQSALNFAANGGFDRLEPDWNRQTHREGFDPVEAIPTLRRRGMNVHFVTRAKPWLAWSPFPAERMFRAVLDAVDPEWRGAEFAAVKAAARRKIRFASWLGPFFSARARIRNSSSDRRTAEYWSVLSADLAALRRRRAECGELLADWNREILEKRR
jgi:lipopolysaccharide biosynthesis glycosyltransferase